ncbi:hypothetical protein HRQ91_11230 [Treponema parvum]|uniref:Uncharacterized protein n=1 Tax=Treponema parvum TaxID=138851 RepID=A0A975IFH3_9SPIR|nr:hypothetical protein [Treponema parvum]QTQ14986.1 hypothetical protein HRQ91_11230 [Treponema parvum]
MKNFLNRFIASFFILIYSGAFGFAEELNRSLERGKIRLEHYLDRASLERSKEKWEESARKGIEEALSLWENENLQIKESDTKAYEEGRQGAQKYFNSVAGLSYVKWLCKKLEEEQKAGTDGRLKALITAAAKERIEENRDPESAAREEEAWRAKCARIIEEYGAEWEANSGLMYTELALQNNRFGLSEGEILEKVKNEKSQIKNRIAVESSLIAQKEGRELLLELMYDRKSAKNAAAKEAAGAVVRELSDEVTKKTEEDMNRLFQSLETQLSEQEADAVGRSQDEWLEKFKAAFNKGLSLWENAETRFLEERSEWEKNAQGVYAKSEESWLTAYRSLKEKRKEWEKNIEEKIKSAEEKLSKESRDYFAEIQKTLDEYKAVLSETSEKNGYLAEMEAEFYNKTRDLTVVAKEGIEAWGGLWSNRYRGLYSYWKTAVPQELEEILAENRNSNLKNYDVRNLSQEKIDKIKSELDDWKQKIVNRSIAIYNNTVNFVINDWNRQISILNNYMIRYVKDNQYDDEGRLFTESTRFRFAYDTSDDVINQKIYELKNLIYKDCESYDDDTSHYYFDKRYYDKCCAEIDNALATFRSRRSQLTDLNRYSAISSKLNELLSQEKYSEIEAYMDEVCDKTILSREAHTAKSDYTSCSELISWLKECLAAKKQGEEAQKALYRLTGVAEIGGENFYNELDTEVVKAKAILQARREEKEIADAVNEYAETTDWSRESAEQTEAKLISAKNAYNTAYDEYEKAAKTLEGFERNAATAESEMASAMAVLKEKEKAVKEAKEAYDAAMAVTLGVSREVVSLELLSLVKAFKEKQAKTAAAEKKYFQNLNKAAMETEAAVFIKERNKYVTPLEEKIQDCDKLLQLELTDGKAFEKTSSITNDERILSFASELDSLYRLNVNNEKTFEIVQTKKCLEEYIEYLKKIAEFKKEIVKNGITGENTQNNPNGQQNQSENELKNYLKVLGEALEESNSDSTALTLIKDALEKTDEEFEREMESWKEGNPADMHSDLKKALQKMAYEADEKTQSVRKIILNRNKFIAELKNAFERDKEAYAQEALVYNSDEQKANNEKTKKKVEKLIFENEKSRIKSSAASYNQVVDFVFSLKKEGLTFSSGMGIKLDNYIDSYIEAESARYVLLCGDSFDQNALKERLSQLYRLYEKYGPEKNLSDQEVVEYVKLNLEMNMVQHILNRYDALKHRWYEHLIKAGFASDEFLSGSDRAQMKEILESVQNLILENYEESMDVQKELLFAEEIETLNIDADKNYAEVKSALDETLEGLKSYAVQYEQFSTGDGVKTVSAKQKDLNAAQAEAAEAEKEYLKAAQKVREECEKYNRKAAEIGDLYKALDEKRLQKRIAQGVYDWAQSVYLENIGNAEDNDYETPKERAAAADYAYKKAEISLKVLEEVLQGKTNEDNPSEIEKEFKSYVEADKKYYRSLVLNYEANVTLNSKRQELKACEIEAQTRRLAVVRGTFFKENSENRLVYVTKNDDGSYNVRLRRGEDGNAEVQRKYLTKKAVTVFNREINNEEYTKAEDDLYKWYSSMVSNREVFENVAIAAMCVMAQNGWLSPNPFNEEGEYITGIGDPHGIDAEGIYRGSRTEILWNTYNSVMSWGGESDIAKCILFATNSDSVFKGKIFDYQKTVLKERALDRLEDKMEDIKDDNTFLKKILGGRIRNAKGKAAAAAEDKAHDLKIGQRYLKNEYFSQMFGVMGKSWNAYSAKSARTDELNVMMYGTASVPSEKVSKEVLIEKIKSMTQNSKTGIQSEINELAKELTEEVYTDALKALEALNASLLAKKREAYSSLQKKYITAKTSQAKKEAEYQAKVSEECKIDEDTSKKLKALAQRASDKSLSIEQRKAASDEYDALYSKTAESAKKIEKGLLKKAKEIFGNKTVNTESLYKKLLGHYSDYINPEKRENFFVNENRVTENYYASAVTSFIRMVKEAETAKNESLSNVYAAELEASYHKFMAEKSGTVKLMKEIAKAASNEWNKAEEKLRVKYNSWKKDFLKEYKEKSSKWYDGYEKFLASKQAWIDKSYMNAAAGANEKTLNQAGVSVEETIEKAMESAKSMRAMEEIKIDAEATISEILGLTGLEKLTSAMKSLEERLNEKGMGLYKKKMLSGDTSVNLSKIQLAVNGMEKKLEASSAKLAAYQAQRTIDETIKGYMERIDSTNQGMIDWEKELALGAGYQWSPNGIRRSVVDGATVWKVTYTDQSMRMYQNYTTSSPTIELNIEGLLNLGSAQVMAVVAQAQLELSKWGEKIFGVQKEYVPDSDDERGQKRLSEAKEKIKSFKGKNFEDLSEAERQYYNEALASLYTVEGGEIYEHIGEASDGKNDTKIAKASIRSEYGSGQIGLILLDFNENQREEAKGWAEVALPLWEQKLWDGDNAPNIRIVAELATDVAGCIVSTAAPGIGAVAAAGMQVQTALIFASLDYGLGYKSAPEIGNELGKKIAMTTIETAISLGASGYTKTANRLARIALDTGVSAANTTARTAVVNTDFSNLSFDNSSFKSSMGSWSTWQGTAAAGIGSAVGNGIEQVALGSRSYQSGTLLFSKGAGLTGSQIENLMSMSEFMGNVAKSYGEYKLTGRTTINVLDIADLGLNIDGQKVHAGLLEYTIGGENSGLRLGSGGTNFSYGKLAGAFKGINTAAEIVNKYLKTDKKVALSENKANNIYEAEKKGEETSEKELTGKEETEESSIEEMEKEGLNPEPVKDENAEKKTEGQKAVEEITGTIEQQKEDSEEQKEVEKKVQEAKKENTEERKESEANEPKNTMDMLKEFFEQNEMIRDLLEKTEKLFVKSNMLDKSVSDQNELLQKKEKNVISKEHPSNQKDFDDRFNFKGERNSESCQTNVLINAFAQITDISDEVLERAVTEWKKNDWITKEGVPRDLNKMSMRLAKLLNLDKHYGNPGKYDVNGNWKREEYEINNIMPKEFDGTIKSDTLNKDFSIGVLQLYNKKFNSTHYVFWSKKSGIIDSLDPKRVEAQGYKVVNFKPLKLYNNWQE